MNFKIEWIEYFIVFCEFNNFTSAAKKLNITTASLSQNIKALESFLDIKLIIRVGKNNILTEQGVLFLDKAKNILIHFDKMRNDFYNLSSNKSKNIIKIGWSNIWGSTILPPLVEKFMLKYNNYYPKIYAFTNQEAIFAIENNTLDYAIISFTNNNTSFDCDISKIGFITGKKIKFIKINKSQENISLYDNSKDNNSIIKVASINTLIYLCEKNNFSTYIPEILIDNKLFNDIEFINDKYLIPVLIWNKQKQITEIDVYIKELFIGIAL